jgi:hypothetical protein
MANSEAVRWAIGLALVSGLLPQARAQQAAQGFGVERFYPSAPGGGWFVMDDLNIGGGLGGAVAVTSGYEQNPLVVTNSSGQRTAVVSDEAFVSVGVAVSYDRYRGYVNIPMPVAVGGTSAVVDGFQVTGPSLNPGQNPDTVGDTTVGFDVRLFGKPGSALRIGAGAQLLLPSGSRADFVTDGTYRGMFRVLAAGDAGRFVWAGQAGVHVRPAGISLVPGGPDGNEFLFGASAGRRFSMRQGWDAIVGPEFFGETAVRDGETGAEALVTARIEQTGSGRRWRFKVGAGHALDHRFGAPEWRVVAGAELFGQK